MSIPTSKATVISLCQSPFSSPLSLVTVKTFIISHVNYFHSPISDDTHSYNSYNGGAIWSSGTAGHNCETTDTCLLAWQGDGNLVIYINGAALWSSGTAKRGELLTFTAQSYAIEITGVESEGSAPILWRTPETGNEPDPGPGGPGVCDGESCFSCSDCIISSE